MLERYSVRKPYTVVVAVVLVLVLGVISFMNMTTDLLPKMDLPYVLIVTSYVGASPEEVENTVSKPLESTMATVSNVKGIDSVSGENSSMVILEFNEGANMDTALIEMNNKLNQVAASWDDSVGSPVMMQINPDMMPIMVAAVDAEGQDKAGLSQLVNEEIIPKLESLDGVASASASGLMEEEIHVTISQNKIDVLNSIILEELDSELAEVEKELDEGEAQLRKAKNQLAREIKKGQNQVNDGLKKIEEAKEQLGDVDLEEAKAQIEQQIQEITSQIEQAKATEQQLTQQQQALLSKGEGLSQQEIERLVALQGQIQTLQTERESAAAELEEVNAAIQQAEQQQNQESAEVTEARKQLSDRQAELIAIQQKIDELESYCQDLKGGLLSEEEKHQLQQAQNDLASVKQTLETLSAEQPTAGEAVTRAQGERDSRAGQVSGLKEEVQALENERQQMIEADPNADTSEIDGRIEGKKGELSTAEGELQKAEQALSDAQGKLTELNNQIQTAQTQQAGLEETIKTLTEKQSVSEENQAKLDAAQAQLETLNTQKGEAQQAVDEAQAALDQLLNGDSGESGADLNALRAQKAQLESKIAECDGRMPALQSELDALNQKLGDMTAEEAGQLQAINAQLAQVSQGRAQMEAGLTALNESAAQVEQGLQLYEQEDQLKAAKKELKNGLSTGNKKIADAQKELGEARKEFNEKREEAFKEAKLDGVITVEMISSMLPAQNFSMPAGYIKEDGQQYLVKVGDKITQMQELKDLLLFTMDLENLKEVRLNDVATVELTDNNADMYAKINGNDGIILSIQKQSTASTAEVCDAVKARFEELQGEIDGLHLTPLMDQGIYIDMVVDSVLENLLYGGLLAILILAIFMFDIKPTIVVACSIPISVVAAVVLMYFSGVTLNVISLSGLALGVGMLVDNSIVVIENIYRLRSEGVPPRRAAVMGAGQVAGAIISSTLTTVCVFLPIVFVEGISRQLFADMGLTIAYSLLASLIVALTLVPSMCATVMKKSGEKPHRIFDAFQRGYGRLLRGSLRIKPLVLLLALAILVWSVYQVSDMGTIFMPEVDGTQMSVTLTMPEGARTDNLAPMANELMARLLEVDDVETVGAFSGSAGLSMGSASGQSASFYIKLREDKTHTNAELAQQIQDQTADMDCEISVSASNMDMSALMGSGVSIVIKGEDTDQLQAIAREAAARLGEVEGIQDVSDGLEETVPELRISVDKEAAIREGLTVAQVYQFIAQTVSDGYEATSLTLENQDYPTIVIDGDNQSLTRQDIADLYIDVEKADETVQVRVGDIAEVSLADGLSSISREDQQRTLTVSAGVDSDHNIGLVSRDVEAALQDMELPQGYSMEMAGENETINEALGDLVMMIAVAILFIYLIMVAQFQSLLSPFIVLFTIPLAFTGGLLALIFADMEISIVAMLGFLVLAGVVVNNGIVFVDCVNQLRLEGMEKREALVKAGETRLRPILMTALTTILGMSTMAMGIGGMGAEMMQPMALVTIGGLSYATLLTLFVVPALYDLTNRRPIKRREIEAADRLDDEMEGAEQP